MKKTLSLCALLLMLVLASCCRNYSYQTVPNDPLKARIYTLDNGLKVYLTQYPDAPRIQTYIAVRVGGKNDPAETTGLAHYFEHLMFKGTQHFGTKDYASEKPYLDQIEQLFETYRATTDPAQRKAIYHQIDSVSQLAAQYAIANEYDKLMTAIGANGTNAYTSYDATVYMDDIPANQVENWAKIQADRFSNPVIRLFHTELETVYEEKNMSLTRDGRKVYEALLAGLFPYHPYGTQTILGTQDDLKNPSITNIKKYFDTYYVPNNMAVCISGDFDPDQMIKILNKYFGAWQPKPVPALATAAPETITQPIQKTIYGPEAESVTLGYRFGGANTPDAMMVKLMDMIVTNGHAGLVDLNINKQQKLLAAGSYVLDMTDAQAFVLTARPKQGQSLEQAKDILLEQVELLKQGKFDDWLLKAVVTDFKLSTLRGLEDNSSRAHAFVSSFVNGTPWATEVDELDRMAAVTKDQLVAFANQHLANNYVVIYKRTGQDTTIKTMDKPQITPVPMNRDDESAFLAAIKLNVPAPIEPVFVNFDTDLDKLKAKSNIEVLYKQNTENQLFQMHYLFEMGSNHDKEMALAVSYLKYLGTSTYTSTQLSQEFYKLGCSFDVSSSTERLYVTLSGLSENMEPAMQLFEHLLANAQVNQEAYTNLAMDMIKARQDSKLNQSANFGALQTYGTYGKQSPATHLLSGAQLRGLNPQVLVSKVHALNSYQHLVLYYGPLAQAQLVAMVDKYHNTPATLQPVPTETRFVEQPTGGQVYFAHYPGPQIYMGMQAKLGQYNKDNTPLVTLYNEYFSGGMNAIVFQEMREARGLAYSAGARYSTPQRLDRSVYMNTFIATQADKMHDAVSAFDSILNQLPQSAKAFDLAKESIITNIRTERINKDQVLWNYLYWQRLGVDYDIRRDIFAKVPTYTLADVTTFQQANVRNLSYTYCILGDKTKVDFGLMKTYGALRQLSQDEMFGY